MTAAEFALKRKVTTIVIIIVMFFLGLVSMMNMKQELLPNFDIPVVVASVTWNGASPEDVDSQITRQVEDAVLNVDGIKKVMTNSQLGVSTVVVQFEYGEDTDIKQTQIQAEVDKIKKDLPSDSDSPIVGTYEIASGNLVLLVNFSGSDAVEITTFASNMLEQRLKRIKGVGAVDTLGGLTREIRVEVDPYKLEAFGLTPVELYSLIQSSNTIIPSGFVKEGGKEFLLRVLGEIKTLDQVENILIRNNSGQTLKLKDVSKVSYTTKDRDTYSKLDGTDAVSIAISKTSDGNLVEISDKIKEQLKELEPYFPSGSKYEIIYDGSQNIKDSIANVRDTAVGALVLAVIVLLVFLKDIRATLVVALAVPISIVFTFFLLTTQGVTLNLVSLMGLSLGVGSLVDNSVVVLDNIFRHMTEEREPIDAAAINGTNEVGLALVASTATSVCVFFPILLQQGAARMVFKDLSLSIMFAHSTSIVVALLFVPLASKFFLDAKRVKPEGKFFTRMKEGYYKFIGKALDNKAVVIISVLIMFVLAIFGLRFVKMVFFPQVDNKEYAVVAELSSGLDLTKSYEVTKQIENVVSKEETTGVYSAVVDKGYAIVNVKIKDKTKESTFKVMDRIRDQLQDIPDIKLNLSPNFSTSTPNRDFEFLVQGDNIDELDRISKGIIAKMQATGWLKDIKSSYEGGNPQARVIIDREKAATYGISVSDVATLLNMSVLGIDPINIREGNDEIDVTIQLEEQFRDTNDKILDLSMKSSNGSFVRLRDFAHVEEVEGPSAIEKQDGLQQIKVGANIGTRGLNEALEIVQQAFKDENPASGYQIGLSGDADSQQEMGGELAQSLLLSIFLMYFIMAAQLESFSLPLILLGTLPLSLIGVTLGLLITNTPISMFVLVGLIMLAGMVVNNAIVLLDFIGLLRSRGVELRQAIMDSGRSRLRPILMTTLTTVLGWVPLALGIGTGAGYYQGMSIAVIFGLSSSTLLTLVFIPVVYSIVEERKLKAQEKKKYQDD